MRRRHYILGLVAFILIALTGLTVWRWMGSARELVYVIPAGSAARQAAGEEVTVLPQTIEVRLSEHDTLVIRNDDTQTVTIGPFRIEPGQRFVQRYYNPGVFELDCTVHISQQLKIVVKK